ncbi:MAG TPA: ATP-binding cassette domain-containing protein, partial [Methanomicrobiales archaeon]|nr:ATP-binding cassette domain-containing protein [Methanomicrobiales archaeon]
MLALRDVCYTYPAKAEHAIEGVNLALEPGHCMMVVGPSGAGKTTLCLAAAGILQHEYGGRFGGRVSIQNRD